MIIGKEKQRALEERLQWEYSENAAAAGNEAGLLLPRLYSDMQQTASAVWTKARKNYWGI